MPAVTARRHVVGRQYSPDARYRALQDVAGILSNVSDLSTVYTSDMFGTEAVNGWAGVAGSASTDGTRVAGVRKQTTAASANAHSTYVYDSFSEGLAFDVAPRSTAQVAWGVSYRARFTGTVEAAMVGSVGLSGGGTDVEIGIGIFGSGSPTKWGVRKDTSSYVALTTQIDIDTAYHQFDLAYDLASLWARIDRGQWIAVSSSGLYDSYAYLLRDLRNGATASARTMEIDWINFLSGRVA